MEIRLLSDEQRGRPGYLLANAPPEAWNQGKKDSKASYRSYGARHTLPHWPMSL